MKKIFTLFCFLFCFAVSNHLFAQVSGGVTVVGNWTNSDLPPHSFGVYNEVWAVVVNDHEYGIVGSVRGTHFIDLEANPLKEVFFVAGRDSVGNNIHRDFHHYQNYLYAVCDEGQSSLQIMDFSGLPNNVELVYDSDEFMVRSHNIFIDEDNARLYNTNTFNWYLSLADPENPVQVNIVTSQGPPAQHDLFVKDNIAYLNCQNNGFWVYDVNDPGNTVLLGNLTSYPNQGYNHSGWLNETGTHYFLCEETTGADIKSIDVTDKSDLQIKKRFNVGTPYENLPHNAMITGDYLYISYYYDGLQVYDISDPEEPFRVAFYDTFDGPNEGFRGAWGVYSELPSGRILISDMTFGLFLLEVTPGNYPTDAILTTPTSNLSFCANLNEVSFSITIGDGFDEDGVTLDIPNLPANASVTYSMNPALPGSTVDITVSGLTASAPISVTAVDDEGATFFLDFTMTQLELLPVTPLLEPANQTENVGVMPTFSWDGSLFFVYLLEVSTDPNNFESGIFFSQEVPNKREYELTSELFSGTYYWRISTANDCGRTYSEIFEFSTNTVAVQNLWTESIAVYPNPAADFVWLTFPDNKSGIEVSLLDVQGRKITQQFLEAGQLESTLNTEKLSGVYFIQLREEGTVVTKRLVVTP